MYACLSFSFFAYPQTHSLSPRAGLFLRVTLPRPTIGSSGGVGVGAEISEIHYDPDAETVTRVRVSMLNSMLMCSASSKLRSSDSWAVLCSHCCALGFLLASWSRSARRVLVWIHLRVFQDTSPCAQSHVGIHARAGERGVRIQGTGVCRVVHAPCAQDLRDTPHTWSTRLRLLPRPWCFSLMLHVNRVCVINHACDSAGLACKSPPLSEVRAVLAGGDGHAYSPCPGLRMHSISTTCP